MKLKTVGNGRIWILFGLVLAVLAWSTVIGTQPVLAGPGCTTQRCNSAYNAAVFACLQRGSIVSWFSCPVDGNDDYFFYCIDGFHQQCDCVSYCYHS